MTPVTNEKFLEGIALLKKEKPSLEAKIRIDEELRSSLGMLTTYTMLKLMSNAKSEDTLINLFLAGFEFGRIYQKRESEVNELEKIHG